ncbi:hypothetical protein ACFLS9_00540 [Bacteroidota bacterium]
MSVPLSTNISFTFNAPLDTTMRFGQLQFPISLVTADPLDSLDFGAISYSTDLRTISFEITHTANTDFVWLVISATNNTGQQLSQSYALNYTTSAAYGTSNVSGTITLDGGDPVNAVVALLDKPLFGEEEPVAWIGAVVANSSGLYNANYVRDGVYWPIAVKDIDGDGEFSPEGIDAIGIYDPNHDSNPDSIIVSGSDLTGVDMELRSLFVPVTAKIYLDTATVIANQYASDQELRGIGIHADPMGIDVGLDGTASMWAYLFYSPSLQFPTVVLVSPFLTGADTTMSGFSPDEKSIPENFVDSDIAMGIADANGGHDFESQHNIVRRTLYGGNMWSERFLQDSTKIIWVAEYEAMEPDSSSLIFRVFIDMITGGLITGVEEPEVFVPLSYSLSQNYPNPFNPSTKISYSISTPPMPSPYQGEGNREGLFVSLIVYDILGNEITTLVNESQNPGIYEVVFDAGKLVSGVYFYQLRVYPAESGVYPAGSGAGNYIETKKMILMK